MTVRTMARVRRFSMGFTSRVLSLRQGDGVEPAGVEDDTLKAFVRQGSSLSETVNRNGLNGVVGTGWVKTATGTEERGDHGVVSSKKECLKTGKDVHVLFPRARGVGSSSLHTLKRRDPP